MAENRYELNKQLAQMLKGGCDHGWNNTGTGKDRRVQQVPELLWLWKKIPADIRAAGGVARMRYRR